MMRRAVLALFVVCLGTASWAEPVVVQSGEHAGYSRLVVPLAGSSDWRVSRGARTVSLVLDEFDGDFALDGVFDLIPRDRITSVTGEADALTVTLGCDCNVSAFLERDAFIVIDVATPGVVLSTPLLEQADKPVQTSEPKRPLLPRRSFDASTTARVPLRLPKQDLSEPARVMLQDVQDDLARELGNAATTGLLTPKRQDTPAIAAPLKTPAPPEPKEPPTHRMLPESPLVNLRVTSSRDRLLNANGTQENFSADGVACPDPAVFDVANWGDARPFHIQIAEARHGLFTEADRLDGKVALNLARKFLYFGFGAEARQVLALDPSLAADHVFLLDMADLFDARTANSATRLSTFAGCDSAVSLWAILSLPDGASPLIPSVDPALRTLNSLPVHLRIVLAPMLSRKLQDLGQSDAAAAALRSLKRLPEGLPPAGQLVRAKSAIESGDTSAGTAALKEVAEGNSVSSPEALVALVDAQLAANRPISREIASLIAAYAKEFRNTPQGAELRRAHVIALLKSGQFDAAFDAARILGADADTQSANALRRSMLRELTTYASDIDFLHHIFARADTDIAALEEADIARLAGRFLDLGFPQRAERALATLSWGKTADETRLIAARVSLAMEKPFKAQADLLGVDGDTSDRLRAEAKRMAGAHDDAHRLFASMNDAGLAEESAWLAEGWRDLLPRDAPIFGPVSALSVPEPTSEEAPVGMLARSAALLQESAEARQTLDDLLAADRLRINADE